MSYCIDKQFDFCYGHRVWTQKLNSKYSIEESCKCRHLHGHQGKLKIGLNSNKLENGMVTDFKHLNCIKKLIDDVFDHKFIMDVNDPLFFNIFNEIGNKDLIWNENKMYAKVNPESYKNKYTEIQEKLEGLVVVNFVPTSENLCQFFAKLADFYLDGLEGYEERFKVMYVDFWETPKSHCKYEVDFKKF